MIKTPGIFSGNEIEYVVERSGRRRTLAIIVDPYRGVIVKAPLRLSDKRINDFVRLKTPWIMKKLEENRQRESEMPSYSFVGEEVFNFMGKEYVLDVKAALEEGVDVINGRIVARVVPGQPAAVQARRLLKEWCMAAALEKMRKQAAAYAKRIGVPNPRVKIGDQKKRWGSCSSKGSINLNWKLITAPPEIMEYVVAHEICHLKHPSHQKPFWRELEKIMPDYKSRREWLKNNGHTLGF